MVFRLVLIFCVLLCQTATFAQKKEAPVWSFGANPYYGGVLRYKPEMPKLKMTDLYGLELYANKITNGSKPWQSLFNYPHVGFAAAYYNYGDPDELGEVYSLATYLDFSLNPTKRSQWRMNIGTGLVYSTRRFDAEANPENKAISSRISYILRGTIHYEIQLSPHYYLNLNAAFRHYSNGKLNMPNNGMNFPVVGAGLRYVVHPEKIIYYKDSIGTFDKRIKFNLMLSNSWREVLREDYKHKANTLSLYLSKRVSRFNAVLLGIDGFLYDKASIKRALGVWKTQNPSVPDDYEFNYDGKQIAITVGTELYMGKISVIVQGGFYVYKPQKFYEATWYQRYGLKYQVINNIFTQLTLKAHSRTADMVEFGAGISF